MIITGGQISGSNIKLDDGDFFHNVDVIKCKIDDMDIKQPWAYGCRFEYCEIATSLIKTGEEK